MTTITITANQHTVFSSNTNHVWYDQGGGMGVALNEVKGPLRTKIKNEVFKYFTKQKLSPAWAPNIRMLEKQFSNCFSMVNYFVNKANTQQITGIIFKVETFDITGRSMFVSTTFRDKTEMSNSAAYGSNTNIFIMQDRSTNDTDDMYFNIVRPLEQANVSLFNEVVEYLINEEKS